MGRPLKKTLPVEIRCFLSDVQIGSKHFAEHYANAYPAKNVDKLTGQGQSVYVQCFVHGVQGFINNPTIVELVNAETEKQRIRNAGASRPL